MMVKTRLLQPPKSTQRAGCGACIQTRPKKLVATGVRTTNYRCQAHDGQDVGGDFLVKVLVSRFGDDGEVDVLRMIGATADEREGEEHRRRDEEPSELAPRDEGKSKKARHVQKSGNGAERPARAHAGGGDIAHDAHVRLERTVHVIGAGGEIEQHVAGEHQDRAYEAEGDEGDDERHGISFRRGWGVR